MIKKILHFIDLQTGEEKKESVLESVKSNISFRGSNLWILACAIVVASVGLNVNSTAVIIGAMLISPLMGPIVGAGFGLGTFDFALLKKSLKNLFIATVVSLIVSSLYFYLSPFKETQSELLARTSPTIYDILIAFFGGLVGVIAITRVEKGNPIPGVAIATALMPPLCTAGYGLAIGNFSFFLGALFLYTINCVFICIATFIIVKYLKYPTQNYADVKYGKSIRNIITLLVLALMLPSIYFAYELVNEKKNIQKADAFIKDAFENKGYTLIYKNVNVKSNPKTIQLAFLTKKFTPNEIDKLNKSIVNYGLSNTNLTIKQDTTDLKKSILNEINKGKTFVDQKDITIENLNRIIQSNTFPNQEIFEEIKVLFPQIKSISIANHYYNQETENPTILPIVVYESESELSKSDASKMKEWLMKRLNLKNIEIVRL